MSVVRGPEMVVDGIQSSSLGTAVGSPPSGTRATPECHLNPRAGSAHSPVEHLAIHRRRSKRAIDVIGALVALIVFSPVFLITAIAIYLTDRGPFLFKQVRVGADGRHFQILKFRSMCTDAESRLLRDPNLLHSYLENNCKLAADEDSRLTRIGAFLRASSIDELPQLWNVLKGEMSLVGPRPVLPQELDQRRGPFRSAYLAARPGMTGSWQVHGRSRLGLDQRAEMDSSYVEQWTLPLDLRILLRTPAAVIAQRGAY